MHGPTISIFNCPRESSVLENRGILMNEIVSSAYKMLAKALSLKLRKVMAHKNSYTVLRKVHIGKPIWVIVMMHVCVYIFTQMCLTTNCMHMIWKSR